MATLKGIIHDLIEYLHKEAPKDIFASPEDAAYFRRVVKRDVQTEKPVEKMEIPKQPQLESVAKLQFQPKSSLLPPSPIPPQVAVGLPDMSTCDRPELATESSNLYQKASFAAGSLVKELPKEPQAPSPIPRPPSYSANPSLGTPSLQALGEEKAQPTGALPKPVFSFSEVRRLFSIVAPEVPILEDIPSDRDARKIAERWKTKNLIAPISLLCYQEPPDQRALLEQIAKALDVYFGPARLVQTEGIEKERQWQTVLSSKELKMVIVCDFTLWQLTDLMRSYRENPTLGTRTLGSVPLFLLPDLSLYLKDPLLKRSLWKALCQKLST